MKCQKCKKKLVLDYQSNVLYGRRFHKLYAYFNKHHTVSVYKCNGCGHRLAVKGDE